MLQVGHPAPTFSLPDASMEEMHLTRFRGRKNVVLFFYPRDGTPACTMQAAEFSDREEDFARHDTVVFGVSRDDVIAHAAFRDEEGITVQLLSDADAAVCRKYAVLENKVVDGREKEHMIRSTFIIDKKGILRHEMRDVDPRRNAEEVLAAVKALNGRAR